MALPFYNQGDQDIYASGDHFIPQEQYRLNYTPSQIQASQIGNSGILNTQAANPYYYPQGGGGGGGGFNSTNKFGLDLSTQKTINSGQWVDGNYEKKSRNIAKDASGNWKDVDTNQNPFHANIGFRGVIGTVMDKAMGKKSIPGVPDAGSWTGTEWDEEFDPTIAGRKLNTYQRWKEKKEFVAAQEKAAADKAAADEAAVNKQKWQKDYAGWQSPSGRDHAGTGGIGSKESKAGGAPGTKDASSDWRAEGGRIGMAKGKIPIPRAKTKMGFGDKLWGGIAGLSTLIKHPNLYKGFEKRTESGLRNIRDLRAARIAKYGKWGMRGARAGMGLMNPWTAVPFALGYGAKYAVGKAFDPYRDETGKIGAEGHAQLASAARAREALMAQRNAARQNRRDGGLAGIL